MYIYLYIYNYVYKCIVYVYLLLVFRNHGLPLHIKYDDWNIITVARRVVNNCYIFIMIYTVISDANTRCFYARIV